MNGRVDDYGRALVHLTVRNPVTDVSAELDAWIDTGFTAALMLTEGQIAQLGLTRMTSVWGAMADGKRVTFETYSCRIDWLGTQKLVEPLASTGRFALIGIELLEDCTLTIDYPARTVVLLATPGQGGT